MKDPFRIFNLNEFKKWIDESNKDQQSNNIVGQRVESKISIKKLIDVSETIEGNSKKVLKEFYANGGIVIEKNNNIVLVENKKGKFEIHRMYLRLD